MAIIKSKTLYRADSGKIFQLTDMTASHLLNAICHHNKQLDVLKNFHPEIKGYSKIDRRIVSITETIVALENELCRRNPDDDETDEQGDQY